jgi:cytochrome P450
MLAGVTTSSISELGSIFADPTAYADPVRWHAAAKELREHAPIVKVEVPGFPVFWAITKHADVMEVERHPDIFTNGMVPALAPAKNGDGGADVPVKTLVQMDGAEHKAHRAIVNDWFKPGHVKLLQDRITDLAKQSVGRMADLGGECDFAKDVALNFPLQVILSILGLPEEDYPRMLKLTQELFGAEDPDFARMAEDEAQLGVLIDFVNYFTGIANDRRESPGEDLASVIANAALDGTPLNDLDVLGHYVIIATAGHDTTSNAIAGGLLALMEQPDQLALLQSDPELLDGAAADELIRFVSPVKHFMRTCEQPFTVRDVTFQPGDRLLLSYASANRDEEVFADPFRLDVQRDNALRQLAFGFGPHFCLGAHLARLEIRALFKELLRRVQDFEPAGEATWIQAYFVQGPKSVPIKYRMRG